MRRAFRKLLMIVAPRHGHEWIIAMLSEADQLQGQAPWGWYLAATAVALNARIRSSSVPLQAFVLAIAMIAVDWTWGALLPALVLIALSALVLTRAPSKCAAFLVAAGTLPLAHAVANWVPRLRPGYQYAPLDLKDWIILAAVAAIGVCAVRMAELLRSHPA